ncbi:protein PRRC2C-like [Portunus trituberculatus]|uniref:protein PRRC2C-like n=1 Tax=Portunus trituberculatus TaxID=210409 RepID=UPI001E1D05FD|nr:protein PRRC2C-like [Portunus trituberculatus]
MRLTPALLMAAAAVISIVTIQAEMNNIEQDSGVQNFISGGGERGGRMEDLKEHEQERDAESDRHHTLRDTRGGRLNRGVKRGRDEEVNDDENERRDNVRDKKKKQKQDGIERKKKKTEKKKERTGRKTKKASKQEKERERIMPKQRKNKTKGGKKREMEELLETKKGKNRRPKKWDEIDQIKDAGKKRRTKKIRKKGWLEEDSDGPEGKKENRGNIENQPRKRKNGEKRKWKKVQRKLKNNSAKGDKGKKYKEVRKKQDGKGSGKKPQKQTEEKESPVVFENEFVNGVVMDLCGTSTTLSYGESIAFFSTNDGSRVKCKATVKSPEGTSLLVSFPQFNLNTDGCRAEKVLLKAKGKKMNLCSQDNPSSDLFEANSLKMVYKRARLGSRDCSGGFICVVRVIGDPPTTTPAPTTAPPPTTVPVTTIPVTTPAPTTPPPTTPPPTTPAPTTPPPTTPAPTTPPPTTSAPSTPAPTTPAPTTPAPTTPPPTTPPPTTPAPTTPPPTTPAPTTPPPTTSAPSTPAPTTPAPTTPAPTTPVPTTPTPITPPPTTSAPTTPAPVTPPPTTTIQPPTTTIPTVTSTTECPRLYCDECGIAPISVKENRIVNGTDATLGEYPYQVSVGGFCGGSLIKAEWVLTAAHCFDGSENPASLTLSLGMLNIASPASDVVTLTAKAIIRHENFNQFTFANDIAVIQLSSPVTFTDKIKPICLPQAEDIRFGEKAVVTGWGTREFGTTNFPSILQEVALEVTNDTFCSSFGDTSVSLCAYTPFKDSCQGDSGGPLAVRACNGEGRWVVLGIVSYGVECAKIGFPRSVHQSAQLRQLDLREDWRHLLHLSSPVTHCSFT